MPARHLLRTAVVVLWHSKALFAGILAVYGLVQFVLVYRGAIMPDFSLISDVLKSSVSGFSGQMMSGVSMYTYMLVGGGSKVAADAGVYQSLLLVIGSLAMIWALRHVYLNKRIRIRDAYYKGMYPFIPLLLVMAVITIQLIPLMIGVTLYQNIVLQHVAVGSVEIGAFTALSILVALPTFYMVVSSVMALYIVTLPEMTPMKALRSARNIVRYRRLKIWWRILVIAVASSILLTVVVVPVIFVVPKIAPAVFYAMTVLLLGLVHAYMYGLYRELLRDA